MKSIPNIQFDILIKSFIRWQQVRPFQQVPTWRACSYYLHVMNRVMKWYQTLYSNFCHLLKRSVKRSVLEDKIECVFLNCNRYDINYAKFQIDIVYQKSNNIMICPVLSASLKLILYFARKQNFNAKVRCVRSRVHAMQYPWRYCCKVNVHQQRFRRLIQQSVITSVKIRQFDKICHMTKCVNIFIDKATTT